MTTPRGSAAAPTRTRDLTATLRTSFGSDPIRHVEHLPPRPAHTAPWPHWVPAELINAFRARGIDAPWQHQLDAAQIAHDGGNVVISTSTASGKSLAYQLPVLTAMLNDPGACALYLSPTKALGADQLQSLQSLGLTGVRAGSYDGDTPAADRRWARDHGRMLLTNPDMLHMGILPNHRRWTRLFRNLRYVIVDECHSYRGVFGSHVALVLRRLRRLAEMYGATPTFILASATSAEPALSAGRLIGADISAVTTDSAPYPGAEFVLWEPPLLPDDGSNTSHAGATPETDGDTDGDTGPAAAPARRSASAEAARITAALVADDIRTLTFIRSRAGTEQASVTIEAILSRTRPDLVDTVAAYRGGYLAEDRRALETAFDTGDLRAVVSTNALELGVDIAGIDACVLAGYPGTLASLWQQAGRAGRGDQPALAVFVARDDPLDSYLVHHPGAVFATPVETVITNPANPHVLAPHLVCAAAEKPLTGADIDIFGGEAANRVLDELCATKVLRRRPAGYFYPARDHPASTVGLRSAGSQITIVEADTGRMLGTEDAARACSSLHPNAVYVHQGRRYVVDDLDFDSHLALVRADQPAWDTRARSSTSISIESTIDQRNYPGGVTVATGDIDATDQVTGYARLGPDGTLIDVIGLDMPEQHLATRGVWYTIERERLRDAGLTDGTIGGSLHAAEHAAIGMLPLLAGCDRWDIGGVSTALHLDTGQPTVVVYDGYPGGAGFAEHGYAIMPQWITTVRDAVAACRCKSGCPSCIQSPKCGNGNHPLNKAGALIVLGLVIDSLSLTAHGHG